MREIAGDNGGDLAQPLLFVGHSLGASMALYGGLDDTRYVPDGSFTACFTGADRPDAIVAIAGCYYEYQGKRFPFDASGDGASGTRTVLVGGEDDEICAPWQSRDATEALTASGREAAYVEIPGATHMTLIGRDLVDGEGLALPDHPVQAEVVQVILDLITAEQPPTEQPHRGASAVCRPRQRVKGRAAPGACVAMAATTRSNPLHMAVLSQTDFSGLDGTW